jgi:hypothetical protein
MSSHDKVRALRDPEYRAQLSGFEHPAGLVNEDELKLIAGAGEVNPDSTWGCATVTLVTAAFCPTTACTSQC